MEPEAADTLWESYARAFRSLLWRVHPPHLQTEVETLLQAGRRQASASGSLRDAWQRLYQARRAAIIEQLQGAAHQANSPTKTPSALRRRAQWLALLEASIPPVPPVASADFHCDAGLGGLARWLRAAGYDAQFWPGIDDSQLLEKVQQSSAILLTNDGRLVARGVIQQQVIAALHVSNELTKRGQFRQVVATFQLPLRSARCMACGGRLLPVDKHAVRDRIPPRTFPWRDDYFECARCKQLFWQGTHWERIAQELHRIASQSSSALSGGEAE